MVRLTVHLGFLLSAGSLTGGTFEFEANTGSGSSLGGKPPLRAIEGMLIRTQVGGGGGLNGATCCS